MHINWIYTGIAAALLSLMISPAVAQLSLAELQAKLIGSIWLSTVEGEQRARTFTVSAVTQDSQQRFLIAGTYNFSDGKTTPFKSGEIIQSGGKVLMSFTSVAGSVILAEERPDGSFAGTIRYKSGEVKPIRFEKADAAAAPVTAFDGKWSGPAHPQDFDCIRGSYELTVKDGAISGTATFWPRDGSALRVSEVTGQVRRDNTATLVLKPQTEGSRRSRFQGMFDKDEFKASDAPQGGRCAYEVRLKKAS